MVVTTSSVTRADSPSKVADVIARARVAYLEMEARHVANVAGAKDAANEAYWAKRLKRTRRHLRRLEDWGR